MTVKIIAITKPVDGIEFSTAEDLISYCARVSNPINALNFSTSTKLLKYLIENKHWSPFEMVSVTCSIETTRDIARQILRHRSFSFQEFSQRYADPTKTLGFTTRETRLQDSKNRQNSMSLDDTSEDAKIIIGRWKEKQEQIIQAASEAYTWATNAGIAKEQARSVLPEGLTNSRLYMSGTLRSWIHYCQLRMGNGTQKEHQEIAGECWNQLKTHFKFLDLLDKE